MIGDWCGEGGCGIELQGTDSAQAEGRSSAMDLSKHQTRRLLQLHGITVAPGQGSKSVAVALELSLTLTIDWEKLQFVALWSAHGDWGTAGMAKTNLKAKARIPIDPLSGIGPAEANQMVAGIGIPPALRGRTAHFLTQMWRAFQALDATFIKIDPLVVTPGGEILALDAKMRLDPGASFRHPERDDMAVASSERTAKKTPLDYVKLNGQVGVVGNGAGLVLSTIDAVDAAGQAGKIGLAGFINVGGEAEADELATGFELVHKDQAVKSVLVNLFGGITTCDDLAQGIVRGVQSGQTVVVLMDGRGAGAGWTVLDQANLSQVHQAATIEQAAGLAAQLAAGA